MTANRANFADALDPSFRKIYNEEYEKRPQMYSKIFTVGTSDKEFEKTSSITGFGLMSQVAEEGDFPEVSIYQGYDKTYTHLKYGGMFKITKEMVDDDQYNIMNAKPKSLAQSCADTVEFKASSVIRNSQVSGYNGPDGKRLLSTLHPREDGGSTQSNASSTGITVTETNIETGRLALRTQLNERGLPIISGEKPVIHAGPALEKTLAIMLNSDGRPETTDNDYNFYKGNIANYMIWDWIGATVSGGSDTAWYMFYPSVNKLMFFWRIKPEFDQDVLLSTEVARYKASMRFSYGWDNWRGWWGSAGDGAAYSA
jgi:hypothetical protein